MTLYYRKYDNYEEYLKHQSAKLKKMLSKKNKKTKIVWPECFHKRVRYFIVHLKPFRRYLIKGKVLCLGARTGAEVKAFRRLGFKDSVGIDLNPGKKNKYVIKGDFHYIPFEDNSFPNVFTNVLDHIFDIRRLSKEINRVLVNNGKFLMEIAHFLDFGDSKMKYIESSRFYESFFFDNFKDILEGFKEFRFIHNVEIDDKTLVIVFENVK